MYAGTMTLPKLLNHMRWCCMILVVIIAPVLGQQDEDNLWKTQENLVLRLSREWYNIGLLERELHTISDVLGDVRNLELFPPEVTHLDDEALLRFDAEVENLEKRRESIKQQVHALKSPLSDATGILKEMVAGEPVREMFQVVEDGDIERLQTMIEIKGHIDELWDKVDRLLSEAMKDMGLPPLGSEFAQGRIEQEFFEIVRANLGLQSQKYYEKLDAIKDSLIRRGDEAQIATMYKLEIHRIKQYLEQGQGALAAEKIANLQQRYRDPTRASELWSLLAQADFLEHKYEDVLGALNRLRENKVETARHTALRIQSMFALGHTKQIWEWAQETDFTVLPSSTRNHLLWIALESQLALMDDIESVPRLASRADPQAPYLLHVFHALSRSFVFRDDWPTALSVLDRALRQKPNTSEDQRVYRQIQLARAQVLYELNDHKGALSQFFDLLKSEDIFEDALYGIAWCYLRLGQYQKAETTLRKLINQSPESSQAVEAILLLSKRTLNKADYEWERTSFLRQEEHRIAATIERLQHQASTDSSGVLDSAVQSSIAQLSSMLGQLQKEKRVKPGKIGEIFDGALGMCEVVQDYYEAGSFNEVAFTEQRERLLHRLDSLLTAMKSPRSDRREESVSSAVRNIKTLVNSSRMLAFDILLKRNRWHQEYIAMQKEDINRTRDSYRQAQQDEGDAGREDIRPQLQRLRAKMDTLLAQEDQTKAIFQQKLFSQGKTLLSGSLKPRDRAYVHYHMGEVAYRRENEEFRHLFSLYEKDLFAYDSLMAGYRDGTILEMPTKPLPPSLQHDVSLAHFRSSLSSDPDTALAPAVRYSMAWCFSDFGMVDSAVDQMRMVVSAFPSSEYAPQAWMFLGEHAFESADLEQAASAYQNVMNYPESQWFDDALYKYAWTQYRLSNPRKAISSFLALVDLGKAHSDGKALLEKESMDYIAISFSEADLTGEKGLARATAFVKRFGDQEKGSRILHRLANVYREQGRYPLAEKSFETLLRLFPRHSDNPIAEKELLTVRERRLDSRSILEQRLAYFQKYHRNGLWSQMQEDTIARTRGDSLASMVLYDAAVSMHQQALQSNDSSSYIETAQIYEKFIQAYPQSPKANECHYNLAEILFSVGDYQRAASEYMTVSRRYPNSKYQETAAWNAIVASQNLLKMEKEAVPQ